MKTPPRENEAFTLIELLAALAVIAVLAALLFAVAQRAMESAQNTKCLSNLRGLGAAIFAYAADHNNMLPPRRLGYYREAAAREPAGMSSWMNRLLKLGYVTDPDIFYCPSFFPRNNRESPTPLPSGNDEVGRTYGIRMWMTPGQGGWSSNPQREEHKPFSAITNPSDFFLVVDTLWTSLSPRSQGYGISPALPGEQLVHLRHFGKANALFADGHVEAKDGDYFYRLGESQKQYYAGKVLPFGSTTQMKFDGN